MSWFSRILGRNAPKQTHPRNEAVSFQETVHGPRAWGDAPIRVDLPEPSAGPAAVQTPEVGAGIAVDLGTSASAVATAVHAEGPPFYVHFGVLGEIDARLDGHVPLIGSELLGPLADPTTGNARYILGRTGRDWLERTRMRPVDPAFTPVYYGSVKRMLDLSSRLDTVKYSLGGVFQELLLIALCPEMSATVRARYLMDQGEDDWNGQVSREELIAYAAAKQLGFSPGVRRYLADTIRQAGLDLHVTVPNAFAFGEVAAIVQAARKAGADTLTAWGIRRSGLPTVHVLREAEAVACWHHHCLESDPDNQAVSTDRTPASRHWLVFDMGAGTTDLALVQVDPRGYRLIQRSGLPAGGDDVDLLFIRHLAHRPLREYFADIATGDRPVSFDEVAEHLARTPTSSPHPTRSPGRDDPGWQRLEDTLFLEGLDHRRRLALKRLARECKVVWSQAMRRYQDTPADPYLEELFDLSGTTPDLADYTEKSDLGRYLLHNAGYHLLLHLATRGCCQALLERTGPLPAPVERVIISGRAARLPLVAEALSYALEETGYAHPDVTVYEWPRAGRDRTRPPDEVDSKLAVVRGAAWHGFQQWHRQAPRGASNDVIMQTFLTRSGETSLLFRQGDPLDRLGRARRLVAFDLPERNGQEVFRFRIFHQRLPIRFVETLATGKKGAPHRDTLINSTLCRRILADGFRPRAPHRIGVEIDDESCTLTLFAPDENGWLHGTELQPPPIPASPHPVTGLPEDWLWQGQGAPTAQTPPDGRLP